VEFVADLNQYKGTVFWAATMDGWTLAKCAPGAVKEHGTMRRFINHPFYVHLDRSPTAADRYYYPVQFSRTRLINSEVVPFGVAINNLRAWLALPGLFTAKLEAPGRDFGWTDEQWKAIADIFEARNA